MDFQATYFLSLAEDEKNWRGVCLYPRRSADSGLVDAAEAGPLLVVRRGEAQDTELIMHLLGLLHR